MTRNQDSQPIAKSMRLGLDEQQKIEQKIEFEACKFIHMLVKMGLLANMIAGFAFIWVSSRYENALSLIYWYAVLMTVNILNVLWVLYLERAKNIHKSINKGSTVTLVFVGLICLTWGSIGFLFVSSDIQQQVSTLVFLFAAIICFAFSSSIDLSLGIIGIVCLMSPTIVYNSFHLIYFFEHHSDYGRFNTAIFTSFIIMGLFMLAACIVANKIVKQVFRLGFENNLLRKKLETLNASLEIRVKKRTIELEKSLALVTYQSTHDLLTELPNERMLFERASKAAASAVGNRHKFIIASFSINGRGMISDSIGYEAANTIIQRVGKRFADLMANHPNYFVSLSRQDVFVVLIEPVKDVTEIEGYISYLFSVLTDPIYVAKQKLKLTASIGVSLYPDHGREVDLLITNAESARGIATQRGGNSIRIYESVINADASRQLNIENLLYSVIENNELVLNYQPFIDLKTGAVCGAEALVRWDSPIFGLVSPADFIPLAEANGMIVLIGEWVLRTACKELIKIHKQGHKDFKMSVNLSARQLIQPNLVSTVEQILKEYKIKPQFLELELTESNAFKNESIAIVNKFIDMGISLSIDDFGTGFSEFSSLKLFRVNKIKIDQSFIRDINVDVDSRNIVCNTIALANSMHLQCLAEGVETIEQVKFLKRNGCYIMQGYYFSKPLSADNFSKFLKTHVMSNSDFN